MEALEQLVLMQREGHIWYPQSINNDIMQVEVKKKEWMNTWMHDAWFAKTWGLGQIS